MEEESHSNDIIIELNEEIDKKDETERNKEENKEIEEKQLLAIISDKEYICYAVIIRCKDYLMFMDDTITYDLVKLNPIINVIEDNQQKDINLIL